MNQLTQTIADLRFAPLLPATVLLVLAALCALALAAALWRRARGAVWRGLLFASILLWLAGPRLVEETRQTRPDIALLVVDQTASMSIGDRPALAEAAQRSIEDQVRSHPRELEGLQLRTVMVPETGSAGTRLFAAIDRALADIPASRLAGVMMITDGQVHDIPQTLPPGLAGGVPLHVLLAAKGEETDRRLRVVSAPGYGIVGKSVTLRVVVEDLGVQPGLLDATATADITIRRDGETPRNVTVQVGREQDIEFPITRAGPSVIDLSVGALPGEVSLLNNRAVVTVNGVRDRLRVLLVSGEPHPGERTWRRLLKADPAVDLVHFTILRPPEKDDLTPLNELALIAFPVRELFQVKIREFDLIILDRFTNRGLLPVPYLRNIADYVREGGALLVSAGPEYAGAGSPALTPLSTVLPARPLAGGEPAVINQKFRPQITELGTRHPITQDLPGWKPDGKPLWGPWYRAIAVAPPKGDVLMSLPEGQPLLITDRVGDGRVALLLSDQIWLWSRGHEGGGPQAELLRRVAHWLMKEPELDETSLSAEVSGGQLHILRRSTEAAPPGPVAVVDPTGKTSQLALSAAGPGQFTATVPGAGPGVWQVGDGTRTAYAAAGADNALEYEDLRATASKLAPIVKASGGTLHFLAAGGAPPGAPELRRIDAGRDAGGSAWIGLPRRDDHIVTGVASSPLLPAWFALPLILGLALLAWRREGG